MTGTCTQVTETFSRNWAARIDSRGHIKQLQDKNHIQFGSSPFQGRLLVHLGTDRSLQSAQSKIHL